MKSEREQAFEEAAALAMVRAAVLHEEAKTIGPGRTEKALLFEDLAAALKKMAGSQPNEDWVLVPREPTPEMLSIHKEMAGNELSWDSDDQGVRNIWGALITAALKGAATT